MNVGGTMSRHFYRIIICVATLFLTIPASAAKPSCPGHPSCGNGDGGNDDGSIQLSSGDDVWPGAGDDNSGDDTVLGGAGDDMISGGSGNDDLYGQEGDDLLYGEDGDDVLIGGPGDDLLVPGPGTDTVLP